MNSRFFQVKHKQNRPVFEFGSPIAFTRTITSLFIVHTRVNKSIVRKIYMLNFDLNISLNNVSSTKKPLIKCHNNELKNYVFIV